MHMHTLSSAPLSAVRLPSRLRWRSALVGQGSAERLDHLLSRLSLPRFFVRARDGNGAHVLLSHQLLDRRRPKESPARSPNPLVIFRAGESISFSLRSLFNERKRDYSIPFSFSRMPESPRAVVFEPRLWQSDPCASISSSILMTREREREIERRSEVQ